MAAVAKTVSLTIEWEDGRAPTTWRVSPADAMALLAQYSPTLQWASTDSRDPRLASAAQQIEEARADELR